jgi:hypothetical protein
MNSKIKQINEPKYEIKLILTEEEFRSLRLIGNSSFYSRLELFKPDLRRNQTTTQSETLSSLLGELYFMFDDYETERYSNHQR